MTHSELIKRVTLRLAKERGVNKTICPSEVARHIGGQDEKTWRPMMAPIREQAIRLARDGSIYIKRSGKAVNLDDITGIYRIAISKR